jgi:hypothetical protein
LKENSERIRFTQNKNRYKVLRATADRAVRLTGWNAFQDNSRNFAALLVCGSASDGNYQTRAGG